MATYTHPHHTAQNDHSSSIKTDEKKGLLVAFFVSLAIFILCAVQAHSHSLIGLQATIYHAINNVSLPTAFIKGATIATEALGAAYAIAACILLSLAFKKFRLAWRFFFTAAGTVAAFYIIKKIIAEPRPIAMLHGNLHQRVVETGPGFPSGHASAATALAMTLWFVLPKKWRWISIVWIIVVAWSRLYLGVHTPVDVIGGISLGVMAVCFVCLLPEIVTKSLLLDD